MRLVKKHALNRHVCLLTRLYGKRKGKRQPLQIRRVSVSSPRLTTFPSVDAILYEWSVDATRAIQVCARPLKWARGWRQSIHGRGRVNWRCECRIEAWNQQKANEYAIESATGGRASPKDQQIFTQQPQIWRPRRPSSSERLLQHRWSRGFRQLMAEATQRYMLTVTVSLSVLYCWLEPTSADPLTFSIIIYVQHCTMDTWIAWG